MGPCHARTAGTERGDGRHEPARICHTDPIINLATKLGMVGTAPTERSAIVVAEVHDTAMGLLVDSVSDILTVSTDVLQPVPEMGSLANSSFSDGIIVQQSGMICFLNLEKMFEDCIPHARYGT
jgi:purine-binding chemotaxis protein CheW